MYGVPVDLEYTDEYPLGIYEEQVGNLDRIPFALLDIGQSLLADVCNYQITLLNLTSTDAWFAIRANFPFYVEEYDPLSESAYIRKDGQDDFESVDEFTSTVSTTHTTDIKVGPTKGRKYPKGTNQPGFINPSPEPLQASMAKQEQMKLEIQQLVDQTLESLTGTTATEGVLTGMNYIAYVLAWAENKIGQFWAMYEGSKDIPQVFYPESPEIIAPKDIQAEVVNLLTLIDKTPSLKFKKALMKKIARLKIGPEVPIEELQAVYDEIDACKVVIGDPLNVIQDVINGLVSLETAAVARGYPKDEPAKAADDHSQRLARIQAAQTPPAGADGGATKGTSTLVDTAQARGLSDQAGNQNAGKQEKANVSDRTAQNLEDPTRGQGKDQSA